MRKLSALVVLLAARLAYAGGIEIDEQSARATGTAAAQTAVANEPSAIFYNPAGLVDQPGFNALVGGSLIFTSTKVTSVDPGTVGQVTTATHLAELPTLFLSQRLGKHVAVGFGVFTQWGEHFGYPTNWPGRFIGQFVDITTATFDFSFSVRLLPNVSMGGGLDVIPGQADLYRAANFGAAEGSLHVGLDGVGVGGNVGFLVDLLPKILRLGVMYRSRVDLDLAGHAAISAPIELKEGTSPRQLASTTLILPHTLAIGLALMPTKIFTLSADLRIGFWRDLQALTLSLTDPAAPQGTPAQTQAIALGLHNSWSIRGGGELRVLNQHLQIRLGLGYDATPLPNENLGPLLPDEPRILVTAGLGWHERWLSLDIGYMAVILLERTSTDPDFRATYSTNGHVITGTATIRFGKVASQVHHDEPRPELSEEPPPRH